MSEALPPDAPPPADQQTAGSTALAPAPPAGGHGTAGHGTTGHGAVAHATGSHDRAPAPRTHRVLVYSDDPAVRATVRTALGRRPAPDLGRVEWVEVDSGPKVVSTVDAGGLDLAIFDGEAWPTGGLGLSKQLKDEVRDCPPILVLIARRDDAWLATWSLADAVVPLPIDAPELTAAAAELLRGREAARPVRRAVG